MKATLMSLLPETAPGFAVLVFAALFGLAIGSFLNVVIYRVPAGKSLLPESRCPKCDAAIRPHQNIPVLSWILLRGRCAGCRAPISPRYPLVELGTAIGFVAVALWALGLAPEVGTSVATSILVTYSVLMACSIALALIDIDTMRLPNVIVLPLAAAMLVGLGVATLFGADPSALLRAVLAALALAAFYFVLWFAGGMGLGDVKLAVALGLALGWLGWGSLIVGTFAAFLSGAMFGLAVLIIRRSGKKTKIPFGPWLLLGAWAGIFWGEPITNWYLTTFLGG